MNDKRKTAVVENFDEFTAWLATTPFVVWGSHKVIGCDQGPEKPPAGSSANADSELLAALKSMA